MTTTGLTLPAARDGAWHVPVSASFAGPDRLPDGTSAAGLSRYGDATWDLSPLSRRQHEPARQVNWDLFPVPLRASFKRAGWALVNLPTPEALLERAATCRARQPGTATIASTAEHWGRYAAWLAGRGITRLADVDAACHGEWAAHVARLPVAGRTRGLALNAVSVLWGMAPHLPAADRVPMPPWEAEGLRHYLPPDEGRNENGTAPVHPAVMSPLLTWALRFTEDFAADILAALAEHERLRSRIADRYNPDAASRLAALLDEHARTGTPLPGEMVKGRACAAISYLAGKTGASITQAGNALRRTRLPAGSTAPLGTPVTGQLHGKPWTGAISYHQAPALALRLSAACLIVVAYLSGLRPAELLHLRPGCCPAPGGDGTGPVRYRLHGVKFKAARNDDGTAAPDGEARQWTVIPPVHTAIGILEQLTATSQLFPLRPHWLNGAPGPPRRRPEPSPGGSRGRRHRTGQVITTRAANTRITEFISWVNAYAREHGLDNETIPDDPDGPVTLSRFRRTIAWHIARLPGGTVALAIQYGHLRTLTSEGYSGRSRHGLRDLLDLETARAMASYLQDVSDSLDSGGGVSGPAARRLADAARHAASRYEGLFLSPRQARALLADPALQVHDSPGAFLACNYDPAKALCHPDREAGSTAGHPALDRCDPACANIARTDGHITALTAEIARLRAESASPLLPGPIRQRLAGRAAALEKIAERHARTRITPGDDDARR
jgi:integrase